MQFAESIGQLWLAIYIVQFQWSAGIFLTRWNVITGERGGEVREKKDNFELFHIFG